MFRRIRRLLRLTRGQRRLLASSWLVVALTRFGLWLLPFRTVRSLLAAWARRPVSRLGSTNAEIAWAVVTAGRYVPRATCLVESMAAQSLMVRHGHPATVRIGVAKEGPDDLAGHAWVEDEQGVVFGHFDPSQYALLPPWPETVR
jgi:Transglutaminase-like superfamily